MVDLIANPDIITIETKDKSFTDLGIDPRLTKTYKTLNFIHPTPIQYHSIPKGLIGNDIIAQAKAGTGKTLAYSSIILHKLLKKPVLLINKPIQAMILVPTRELAIQIHKFLSIILEKTENRLKAGLCIGGFPLQDIKNSLKKRQYDILIGTLGRLNQLIIEKYLILKDLESLVLDEADKLFSKENLSNMKKLLNFLKNTQILAFSGTFSIQSLTNLKAYMPKAIEISVIPSNTNDLKRKADTSIESIIDNTENTVINNKKDLNLNNIEQYYINLITVDKLYQQKTSLLIEILNKLQYSICLVFYNEKGRGEDLASDLKNEGFSVTFIHGDQSQSDRIKVMNRLSLHKVNVIVATDLLSRGIDIEGIDLVVNYDMPKNIETYFHRIGRTGRYGKKGISLIFISNDKEKTEFIEKYKNLLKIREIDKIDEIHQAIKEEKNEKNDSNQIGFGYDDRIEWKNVDEKILDEDEFKYFDEVNDGNKEIIKEKGPFDCLNCKICKELLLKSDQMIYQKGFEILKYFHV